MRGFTILGNIKFLPLLECFWTLWWTNGRVGMTILMLLHGSRFLDLHHCKLEITPLMLHQYKTDVNVWAAVWNPLNRQINERGTRLGPINKSDINFVFWYVCDISIKSSVYCLQTQIVTSVNDGSFYCFPVLFVAEYPRHLWSRVLDSILLWLAY